MTKHQISRNERVLARHRLIAPRGLRRGEAAALDREDLDCDACELTISRQLIALPGSWTAGRPRAGPAAGPSPSTRQEPDGWWTRLVPLPVPAALAASRCRSRTPSRSSSCLSVPRPHPVCQVLDRGSERVETGGDVLARDGLVWVVADSAGVAEEEHRDVGDEPE